MAVHSKAQVLDKHGGQSRQHQPRRGDAAEIVDLVCAESCVIEGARDGLAAELQRPLPVLPQQGVLILARHTILAGFWQDEVTTLDVARLEHASDHGVGHAEHLQDVALTVVPRRIRGADGQDSGMY